MKILTNFLFLVIGLSVFCTQEKSHSTPPILYAEIPMGISSEFQEGRGVWIGAELHYQWKKNLFSARYISQARYQTKVELVTPFTPFPIIQKAIKHNDVGMMYGRRWIYGGHSFSVSVGLSYHYYQSRYTDEEDHQYWEKENFVGFPMEVSILWFKPDRRRYRILYLIPVGKPTSIGNSFGFKLVGNISKKSYIGLGMVFGLGVHKKYTP